MLPIETIVTAVDFSETSEDALAAALELARGRRARVHLVHVVPDVFHTPWMVEAAGVDMPELQRSLIDAAHEQLATFGALNDLDPLEVTTAVAVGAAANEIVRYATDQHAQVIVLGSHGHGLVRRFMLGSVADRVLRQARCPVMVVPHRAIRANAFEPEGRPAAITA